ncbi:hypothetical protein [Helicobacter sp. 11S03491-1]|uniref:hypothetical protein n=1 Tax=Helicobacter sp. 11S03491-1 TaxID=1476196 RepID=UPI000BA5A207|nr:hypothetical protein [Helicobacter sp. 11S03491-1]PAF41437.1 hypothetical protein BKH45_06865 [Helicobacter sp. 11S03491-1]
MSFVFKIKRNYVDFQTQEGVSFKYYQPNQRQVLEISKANTLEEIFKANEKLLRENLEVLQADARDDSKTFNQKEAKKIKEDFIEALLENSTLEDFFKAMNEEFIAQRENKRKN